MEKEKVYIRCCSEKQWNDTIRIFIAHKKIFRGETALIKRGAKDGYVTDIKQNGLYCMAWSKESGWSHCHEVVYVEQGYTKVNHKDLDKFLATIGNTEHEVEVKKIKKLNKTKKYHNEVRKISEILNNESYECGKCKGCEDSYNKVMMIINKIKRISQKNPKASNKENKK